MELVVFDIDKLLEFPLFNGKYDKKNANEHFMNGIETARELIENNSIKIKKECKNMNIQIFDEKNCKNCNKVNVCKYQEIMTKSVERISREISKEEIPLLINITCKEWSGKHMGLVR